MSESATLAELESAHAVPSVEDLAAELARLDLRMPDLERDVEQLRSRYLALIAITAAAASAVTKAATTRADRDEIARLRADQLAADDEMTAVDTEKDAAIAALVAAKRRRREIAITLAEQQLATAGSTYRERRAMTEPLLVAFVAEVLDPLLEQIHRDGGALNDAWWDAHEAKGTPPAERGQRPYTGERTPSALNDAIEAVTGFAHHTSPRQVADEGVRRYVDNLRSAFEALKDPRALRAPNDPPPGRERGDSVPFAQTGDGHYVERARAAAGKLSASTP